MAFSLALMRRLFRAGPAMTRSMASSTWRVVIVFWLCRGGEDCGLIDEVGEVCAAEARSLLGQDLHVHVLGHGFALRVNGKDFAPAVDIGQVQDDAPVEAAGAEEGGVQDVGAVGGGQDNDVRGRVETIHLDQYLVQGLLPLVVTTPEPRAPVSAHGVYLVDKDDAG